MRKSIIPALILGFVLAVASCTSCREKSDDVAIDSLLAMKDTISSAVKDSTVWGHLGDGTSMNVYQFVTEGGDTLYLRRSSAEGNDGCILGNIQVEKDKYAVTIGNHEEEDDMYVEVMVNTTQLMGVWKNKEDRLSLYADGSADGQMAKFSRWKMMNGKLILTGKVTTEYGETDRIDTMTIAWLDKDSLKLITPQHVEIAFGR